MVTHRYNSTNQLVPPARSNFVSLTVDTRGWTRVWKSLYQSYFLDRGDDKSFRAWPYFGLVICLGTLSNRDWNYFWYFENFCNLSGWSIVTSNAGTWLSNATLRFCSLAEQCHTHDFLIWLKMITTPVVLSQDFITSNAGAFLSNATLRLFCLTEQRHTHEILISQKNENNPKNEDKFKCYPDLKN